MVAVMKGPLLTLLALLIALAAVYVGTLTAEALLTAAETTLLDLIPLRYR